ncbi:MAG: 3-methyl-2-oxobutanoate dehydrogenase subunit alpha [Candidatus Dormibacteraceae bacterium]
MTGAETDIVGDRERFLFIHRCMAQAKALDDRMHILVKQGRAPFVGSARGHEGIQVGATAALDGPEDWLVPHYRGLGNVVTMGLTAREWMLAVFSKAADPLTAGRNIPGGCFGYRARRVVTVSQVVASWLPKAAGMAYSARLQGKDSVFLCNFGDGATSTGDFHEALNFAGIHRLAVVFVCENNGYAISVPVAKQAGNTDIHLRAQGYGMAGVQIDGSDVPAVYAAARTAVDRARLGEGPTLIEAKIRRINSHTSEDNQARYRTAEDIQEALTFDPIPRFEAWLAGRGWLSSEDAAAVRADFEREAGEAADWAEAQPDPLPEAALTNVFA